MGAGKQGQTPQEETTKDLNDEAFRRVTHINIEHPNDLRLLSTPRTVPLTWRGPLLLRRRIILATNRLYRRSIRLRPNAGDWVHKLDRIDNYTILPDRCWMLCLRFRARAESPVTASASAEGRNPGPHPTLCAIAISTVPVPIHGRARSDPKYYSSGSRSMVGKMSASDRWCPDMVIIISSMGSKRCGDCMEDMHGGYELRRHFRPKERIWRMCSADGTNRPEVLLYSTFVDAMRGLVSRMFAEDSTYRNLVFLLLLNSVLLQPFNKRAWLQPRKVREWSEDSPLRDPCLCVLWRTFRFLTFTSTFTSTARFKAKLNAPTNFTEGRIILQRCSIGCARDGLENEVEMRQMPINGQEKGRAATQVGVHYWAAMPTRHMIAQ
ncbi:uncharacterized protein MYCGRDRAFT_98012 [Zymoseptoria tritici IPO323]|uniref:Uncharacterized protein n=1 Tax=Zymoseptoria tritici (strain CBS 115943 / IPO323) TaxID=336722 RepID=F9XS23_ZYMTI|nr:uncharacterized protein MYCGRDRAFT_98012 [Zymoseptoria tritici IPO323]EGP81894.1 hypothetical protein MYCGRDRAFT_98012 [Zymoseptoria tritici IPO323]